MKILWFEFSLTLRRLYRRKVHTNLLLVTFAVSVTLSALSWTLFQTVHLSQPAFDPKGEYLVFANEGKNIKNPGQPSRLEMETYKSSQTVFSDFAEMAFYRSVFIETPMGRERVLGAFPSARALQIAGAKPLLGSLFTAKDDRDGASRGTFPERKSLERSLWSRSGCVG